MQLSAHPAPGVNQMVPGIFMTGRPKAKGIGDIIAIGGFAMPENYLLKSIAQVNGVATAPMGASINAWHQGMGDLTIMGQTFTTMDLVKYAAIAAVAFWGYTQLKKAGRSRAPQRMRISGTATPSDSIL